MTKDDVLAAVIASAKADGSWTATYMKEEWLFPGAAVPVDMETTAALVTEVKRLRTEQPAQRPWVGLTDDERDEILDIYLTAEGRARAIEAKLKEKNFD